MSGGGASGGVAASGGVLKDLAMNEERYVALMTKLIGEVEHLQNNPPKYVPQEDRAIAHIKEALAAVSTANGGPVKIEHETYVEGRGNLILTYEGKAGAASPVLSFVGSHLDAVPANPETWSVPPYKLTRDGDKLYGRGTTDCMGHVGMITELFLALGEAKPELDVTVVAVFIANEENSGMEGIGVDELEKRGKLAHLKAGPLFWVDCADSRPCIGTGGVQAWELKAVGKLFHSGLPHKAINSLELVMDAVAYVQRRFYEDFGSIEKEREYNFETSSTMKPTNMHCPEGSLNQIRGDATVQGDIRLTPFYSMEECKAKVEGYVKELNANVSAIERPDCRGPYSKYTLPAEEKTGAVELKWLGHYAEGIACDIKSAGYHAMHDAIEAVTGNGEPFSLTGTLPLVRDLQKAGFDVQLVGFGRMSVYHGLDEYALLSEMANGFKVLARVIDILDAKAKAGKASS